MRPAFIFRAFGLTLAILGAFACGSDGDRRPATIVGPTPVTAAPTPPPASPTPPTAGPTPPLAGGPLRLTVTNGWTDAPVPQALVTMDGATAVTDQAGQFDLPATSTCVRATVVARGYLERRTCLPAAATQGGEVTLWPVENDAERAALEAFAFSLGQRLPRWEATPRVGFVPAPDHVVATWQAAARRLNDATTGWFVVTLVPGPDINGEGVIVSPFTTLADCNHGWYPWRYEAAGFCMQSGEEYFVAVARTDPARIATEGMALRVLLYSYGLRPHPLPGVLNATRPDGSLSDFELRTLHMIGLRARAAPLWWPDTEF